jgi:homoserine acetyltransferase
VTYVEVNSTYGHDAFLVEYDEQTRLIKSFLAKTHAA